MARRTLITASILAVFVTLSQPAAAQPADSIPFTLDEHGAVVVPVTIDGKGPFRFLLDTGSSGTAIADTVARKISAAVVAKSQVTTAAGQEFRPVVVLSHVVLGRTTVDELMATTVPADALLAAGPGVVGVLGQDVLRSHNYTLDYQHRVLRWDDDASVAPGKGETRLALVPRDGRVVVELPQDATHVVRLVPDSGTESLVLFTRSTPTVLSVEPLPGAQGLTGTVGSRDVKPAMVRRLKVGQITLHDQPAVTVADTTADDGASDGLMPLHHFASVSFEASGFIVFRR